MVKSFWQFTLSGCVVLAGSYAVAQTQPAVSTRQPLWSAEMSGYTQSLTTQNQLFVAESGREGQPSYLYALDPATGKRQWKSDRAVGNLYAMQNQTIYADNFGRMQRPNSLLMVDARTGKTKAVLSIANRRFKEVIGISQGAFIYSNYGSPGGGSSQDRIIAQTPKKVLWQFDTPPDSQVSDKTGVVQDGVVVLPILVNPLKEQRGYHVTALDAATGKRLWQWKTQEEVNVATLDNWVYISLYVPEKGDRSQPGWVKALDLKTGQERWTHPMTGGRASMASDRELFVADDSDKSVDRYIVLDQKTGAVLRRITLEGSTKLGRAMLVGDTIYKDVIESTGSWFTVENHAYLRAFDAKTGQLKWRTPLLQRTSIYDMTVVGDRLLVFSKGFTTGKSIIYGFQSGIAD